MSQSNGTWRPSKLLRSFSFKPSTPVVDQAKRKQLISESLWPTTLDREGYKAAAILRSFCQDGAYYDVSRKPQTRSASLPNIKKELKKVPAEIIGKAHGVVIFNILRAGLWEDGAGGSGVVVARNKDGSWTAPAAIKCSTPEVGVVLGADIFDAILVLNTQQSLDSVKKGFCVIGRDLYSVAGPLDVGWFLEADERARNAPIFSYFRSQQFYADIQAEDFAFNARDDENQNFYSPQMIGLSDILAGQARSPPASINGLLECLKAAQGDKDYDASIITKQAPPSDFTMVEEGQAFAIPDVEDPDQYGYAALEKFGIVVVDAATKSPVAAEEFEFHPSMKSPAFEKYHRKGGDTSSMSGRSNWRQSTLSGFDRLDTTSTRSRNSIVGSSAPTSPPALGAAAEQQMQIQLEDNEPEPTLSHPDDGILHVNGKSDVDEVEHTEVVAARPLSMNKVCVSQHVAQGVELDGSTAPGVEENDLADHSVNDAGVAADPTKALDEHRMSRQSHLTENVKAIASSDGAADDIIISPTAMDSSEQSTEKDQEEDDEEDDEESDNFEDLDEDFEIHDASATQPATTINPAGATAVSLSQAKVVSVAKATTPSLPVRNPVRLTMLSPPASSGGPEDDNIVGTAEAEHSPTITGDGAHEATKVEEPEPVSPVSFTEAEGRPTRSATRSRSVSPEPLESGPVETTNSLAAMRMSLGAVSPEVSPERHR